MRRTQHRKDDGHDAVAKALAKVTEFIDVHNHADGMGDFLARHVVTKQATFIEYKPGHVTGKDGRKARCEMTPSEAKFHEMFPRNHVVCLSVEDALRAVGVRVDYGDLFLP